MTHHKTGFLLLNISAALKNKLQTCWLLKKIVYTDKKRQDFWSIQTVRWCYVRYAGFVHMRPDKSRAQGRKRCSLCPCSFLPIRCCALFFLKQSVLPLGPLATLARLHDHIRQLLHLEMRRISVIWKCCVILEALNMLVVVEVPYAACPRSTGWAVAPMSEEHSRAEQMPPGCDVYKGPGSV